MGRVDCDFVLEDVNYLDVFSLQWVRGSVAVFDGRIVGLESGLRSKRKVQGRGRFLVPGFIDAHVHIESSLVTPSVFEKLVLPKGTTTAICDPHELTNVLGRSALGLFLKAAERTQLDLRVMLSSCVPATNPKLETNGAGVLLAKDLIPFRDHEKALGLAEMMNFPGVIHCDPHVLDKIIAFNDRPIDGHAPLVSGRELSAYVVAGIRSCHESTRLAEAQEKLRKGMAVWIREGSVAKDLQELAPLVTAASSAYVGFCTDDRNPLDIEEEGHLDHLIRASISMGIAPELAFRSASLSVARHYGLTRKGAIAPGYDADFVLLGDEKTVAIEDVWVAGQRVRGLGFASDTMTHFENSIRRARVTEDELRFPEGRVHTIGVLPGKIVTDARICHTSDPDVLPLVVCERYGHKRKPALGFAQGFGVIRNGALASSVGHDSHNLIAVGSDARNIAAALNAVRDRKGGFAVVKDGVVIAELALPMGGLMTHEPPKQVVRRLRSLRAASQAIGCTLHEAFLQMAFLSLPVIPALKLTDRGLVDVINQKIINVRV